MKNFEMLKLFCISSYQLLF